VAKKKGGTSPQPPKRKAKRATPIRKAVKKESFLHQHIKNSIGAVKDSHRVYFDRSIRDLFEDSIDADEAMRQGNEQSNRWDYVLGHTTSEQMIAVEPHSASNGEISVVINKKNMAIQQLSAHFIPGVYIKHWIWVASGKTQFLPMEKNILRLDQSGIKFVGGKIMQKHLPAKKP
jgi:hypothetical protein